MVKKMIPYGTLQVTLHDGKDIEFDVYKAGREVDLRFVHPTSGRHGSILVGPLNQGTVEGWVHEIGVQWGTNISIASWKFEDC